MASLSRLDLQLKKVTLDEVLVLNQLGEQEQLEKKSRNDLLWFVLMTGLGILLSHVIAFDGILSDYLQIGLALLTLGIGFWAYRLGGTSAFLGTATALGLWGIYYLVIANVLQGAINGTSVVLGTVQVALALFYIQKANRYIHLERKTSGFVHRDLYDAVYSTLSDSTPNSSNQLLELQDMMQVITVWLRPSYSVILLKSEKRLFFDTTQSFMMTMKGQDRGGDTVKVDASIIDRMRVCSISRRAWLRYVQFVK